MPVTWQELETIDRANAFDVFAAAELAQGPEAWEGYRETEQILTQRIQEVIKKH